MKVATTQAFDIVYSIFHHEYLGYLIESFVVQINSKGEFSFVSQNISTQNANEFAKCLDETDYKLIELSEKIHYKNIIKKYYSSNRKVSSQEFFHKVYHKKKPDKAIQGLIHNFLEAKKQEILPLLKGKNIFVMAKDGTPTGSKVEFAEEPTSVLFRFNRNEKGTKYSPTLKYKGKKLEFKYKHAQIIAEEPAWMLLNNTLYYFSQKIDGKKLKPFLYKNYILVKKDMEEAYYKKFVAPLIASFNVRYQGFEVKNIHLELQALLKVSEYMTRDSPSLFGEKTRQADDSKIMFELAFQYGDFVVAATEIAKVKVKMETIENDFVFHKIHRKIQAEKQVIKDLEKLGLDIKTGRAFLDKNKAFFWIANTKESLEKLNIEIISKKLKKQYFLGKPFINLEFKENRDWLDIHAIIKFGEHQISFLELRKLILRNKTEFKLPDGTIAVIPEDWLAQLTELFNFSEDNDAETPKLRKYHLPLIQDLQNQQFARVNLNKKLEKFKDFKNIEEYPMPQYFNGKLRSYQKAGYNWLRFLDEYNFGGCLADDMGLGKTAQALALLQAQKEKECQKNSSLLIIPTSLIYNWQLEAKKFAPKLKVLTYAGSNRPKNIEYFQHYDMIITSYGIARIDINILEKYYFNYVILDESQVIKNPESNISKSVRRLKARNRLILTGTPLENSVLDLWSQMSFINPGLLGGKQFFKNQFLNPIEKQNDKEKSDKLSMLIKPFILRRHKSQVATDLPQKVENLQYCSMSEEQEKIYERIKSQYRNKILENIEIKGSAGGTQMLLIEGLTKLRQVANHPKMIDETFEGGSGKLEDVFYKLENILNEGSKVLIFSQFVKHLELLKKYLDKKRWSYAYLVGGTKNRQHEVHKFQNDPDIPIFLISLRAGGVGLNLTAAEYVFLLDPWWNPAPENQAIDRAHRIGQEKTVFAYKFITKNTVEEKILALQQNKQRLAEELITTDEQFFKKLSREDVLSLLD